MFSAKMLDTGLDARVIDPRSLAFCGQWDVDAGEVAYVGGQLASLFPELVVHCANA
jgi:hypothetical protein